MKSKVAAALLILAVSLIGSRAAYAEMEPPINYVGQSQSLYYTTCFPEFGTPTFADCAEEFWYGRKSWLAGRLTGYIWSAAMWCPQGAETSSECAVLYANWDSCQAAYNIAVDEYYYWQTQ